MPAPYSILIMDLHNTLYDEVIEYGTAIEAVVSEIQAFALSFDVELPAGTITEEIATLHRITHDDWDPTVFAKLPCLHRLLHGNQERINEIATNLTHLRSNVTSRMIKQGMYEHVGSTLTELSTRGVACYVLTECSAAAAVETIQALGLDEVLHGLYSWPSVAIPKPSRTPHFLCPEDSEFPNTRYKKPHPLVLATIIVDHLKQQGLLPPHIIVTDVFGTKRQENYALTSLASDPIAYRDSQTVLTILPSSYTTLLETTLASCAYLGDSKFKDGLLARNTGVDFIYAEYGKTRSYDETIAAERCLEWMLAVTSWDKNTLHLTQNASHTPEVAALTPSGICYHSIQELLPKF